MSRIAERAVLVHRHRDAATGGGEEEEFSALARAAGADVAGVLHNRRGAPDPRYFLGRGKVEEAAALVAAGGAELVLVDDALTPAQERNLEGATRARVLDRTGLILDIFAQRARSFEGRLEVERAQLRHLSTRLVRGWTHLERQKGGIGLRGPGESQLETDRRLIGQRIRQLDRKLAEVSQRRAESRARRRRNATPVIALVGYTNAGKTTLFNRLTGGEAYAANQLFATLDPLLRRIELSGVGHVVLADTVGFVCRLPHELVTAFKATLTEARDADLLLHVVDASDPDREERMCVVNEVLADIGAGSVPQVVLYNKADLVPGHAELRGGGTPPLYASATTGSGLDALRAELARAIGVSAHPVRLELDSDAGRLRARLFELDAVVAECIRPEGGWLLDVRMRDGELARFLARWAPRSARLAAGPLC